MNGNKLRDALRKARVFISCSPLKKVEDDFGCIDRDEICAEIGAILAEPVKNCEVGTPEEQAKRLHDYCKSHRCLNCSSGNGDECKFYRPGMKTDCKIEWANAPYESEVAK